MARLIDADIADVVIIYDKNNELTPASEVREYIKRQKAFLDKFPTIDAVPVVRCRDCEIHGHCATEDVFSFSGISNLFCCAGKRKDGDGNE